MQLSEIRNPNIEITNYVVSGISFLGEILVLITYCIVSEVRNLRSKLIVGLILSDIVATLANLTGSEISDEGSCIINGFLRQYGFTSSIVWVSIISYASRREVQNFGEDMSKLYTNFVLIAWMLPLLPTLM
jgi:7 transmembrane receptor (Secretin family).